MRVSPLLVAAGAGLGTMAVLGGTTMLVSKAALAVVGRVSARHKAKTAIPCCVCSATGFLPCQVCRGKGILRCRQPRSLMQLRWAKGGDAAPRPPAECTCPACGTTLQQRCLNCLGEGRACMPPEAAS